MALSPEAALPAAVPTWPDGAHWSDRRNGSDRSHRPSGAGWRHRSNGSYRGVTKSNDWNCFYWYSWRNCFCKYYWYIS